MQPHCIPCLEWLQFDADDEWQSRTWKKNGPKTEYVICDCLDFPITQQSLQKFNTNLTLMRIKLAQQER